ncbi:MAG: response regulator transcription factor [Hungatella sp.]|nr:response regulator transcription factor [Hungatella sp.]
MRILVIEDDKDLCWLICQSLKEAGYETDHCHTGTDGLFYARNQVYDAIILDRMLPEIDGLTVLEALRRHKIQTPVILATALNGLHDRINGLDAGADDYLPKPFAVEELMARIRAVTRRSGNLLISSDLTLFGLSLNPDSHQLNYDGTSLTLSKKESALLEYFMKNPNQTLPRSRILSYVWGSSSDVEEGNLDNYIYFLRRRLKSLHAPIRLTTVHGVGYRLESAGQS